MDEQIDYNQSRLEEMVSDFSTACSEAKKIRERINSSLSSIKSVWTGSDNVISQRDVDFTNISNNLDSICNNLDAVYDYLANKNEGLFSASTGYRI